MKNTDYNIQELVHRDVYVNDKKVGTIVGERHHPNEARVQSMRIQVAPDVADAVSYTHLTLPTICSV